MPRLLSLSLALLVAGCSPGGIELFVELQTDYVGGLEVTFARTRLSLVTDPGATIRESTEGLPQADLTRGVRIAELSGLDPGSYRLDVVLDGPAGAVGARQLQLDLVSSRAITAVITRSCSAIACPPTGEPLLETCHGGACADPRCTPESPETCPAAVCTRDSDCAAGASCTEPVCLLGACGFRPGACPGGEACHPVDGCTEVPDGSVRFDASVDGARSVDGGPGTVDGGIECAGIVCPDGTACEGGMCVSCGAHLERCCPIDACVEPTDGCVGGVCAAVIMDGGICGMAGTPCCPGDICDVGLGCDSGTCASCGGLGQSCCSGLCMSSMAVCAGLRCRVCGVPDQLCCAGGTCASGSACMGSVCQTVDAGSPFDGGVDAGTDGGGLCSTDC